MRSRTLQKLPLKELDWRQLADLLGRAHRAVARFDQILQGVSHPQTVFSLLTDEEVLASLQAQKKAVALEDLFLCRTLPAKERSPSLRRVLNYQRALSYASRYIRSKPVSLAFLCRLHQHIQKGAGLAKDAGYFRKRQNWIGPEGCTRKEAYFFPPPYQEVPRYMEHLKCYLHSKDIDPLVQLSIFFAQLLVIHPFMDGNGRLARSLVPIILYKKGLLSTPQLFVSSYFKKHRLMYLERLFAISAREDWEGWIRFFLQGIIEEGEKSLEKAKKIVALYEELKTLSGIDLLFKSPVFQRGQLPQKTFHQLIKRKWIRPYPQLESIFVFSKLLRVTQH